MVKRGDLDRAQALAQAITHPDQKARTFVDLAKRAKPDQVRPLLAWALAVDNWRSLVEVTRQPMPPGTTWPGPSPVS